MPDTTNHRQGSQFHFPLRKIARRPEGRSATSREGIGARRHVVDLVAEEKFRRCDRSHRGYHPPERTCGRSRGRKSLRGYRRLVRVEVRHPGQESPARETAKCLESPRLVITVIV